MTKIFTVDGNIGSGKSTLIEKIKQHYKNNIRVGFVDEPVELWSLIKNADGKNIIEHFYEDQQKWAFCFQMTAYISRLEELKKALNCDYDFIFCERSIFTDKNIFAKLLYQDFKIEDIEYTVYKMWFDTFSKDFSEPFKIYIRTVPEVCYQRIVKRSRPGEQNICQEYLTRCHEAHEEWMQNPELVLDGNVDNEEIDIYTMWLKKIDQYLHI
jgi:deoxyadenosine/deoxycytidine kinase